MANMTRYDPFGVGRYDPFRDMDDLFKGFFVRPVRFMETPDIQIKMNVTQNGKGYTVRAEIPGAKKEDIHVAIDGNQVSVSAEIKQEKEEKKGEEIVLKECYEGKIYRSFTLDQPVDEAGATAKYTDGVLELVLPKKTPAKGKPLAIN